MHVVGSWPRMAAGSRGLQACMWGIVPTKLRLRSRSSAVMHMTPELEVLGSNPAGAISRNAVPQALGCL